MARLCADEHFPLAVVKFLCTMGHDVLTVQEAGNANLGIPDSQVLEFAIQDSRAVLTMNRRDFVRLHFLQSDHCGIIVCSDDRDKSRMAERINQAILILAEKSLQGKLIRVNRPAN